MTTVRRVGMPSPSNGAGAEAAEHGAVVDHGDLIAGDFLAKLAGEERRAAVDRVSVDAFENMTEDGSGDHGIENDGDMRRLHLARAKAPQGALRGDLADFLGRFQASQIARDGEPVVALHGAGFRLRDGNRRHRTIRPAIFADESMRVGQDFVTGGGVERAAFGILDARIVVERRFLSAASIVDALFAGKRIHVGVVEIEIAGRAPSWEASGMPLKGSSEVILASSSADFSMRSRPSREKSLE